MARSRDEDYSDEPPRRRRRDADDDDDRPRRRRDEDEDDVDDRPRARRRRDEEDEDDRPRRRRIKRQLTGMDAMFGNTHILLLLLFSCLCGGIAFILGLIGVITCTDEKAKQNALITLIVSGIITAAGVAIRVAAMAAAAR
jgi:hypothetical protein